MNFGDKLITACRMIKCGIIPKRKGRGRFLLSKRYLTGNGIEIGAFQQPLPLCNDINIKYVDRLTVEELRELYPETRNLKIVKPDIIDDGETLSQINDGDLDFIIANHVLEHCENPCGTIRNHLKKIRNDGILFYAIPDKRLTFDRKRPLTTFEHLIADDQLGPEISRKEHYYEFIKNTTNTTDPKMIDEQVRRLMDINYKIHFHVWDKQSLEYFFIELKTYLDGSFELIHIQQNGLEIISILRKI